VKLPYGKTEIDLDLTGFLKVKTFAPPESPASGQPQAMTAESLLDPVGSPPLEALARKSRRAVIVVPDRTRPRVARDILPEVIASLRAGGLGPDAVRIFVATGTHGFHSETELRDLVGEAGGGLEISQNRSGEMADYEDLGRTRRGTPIRVHRKVLEADLKVLIGPVAYHYFAGWGGGRKLLVPGAAHFETVCANHRLTIDSGGNIDPGCRNGVLAGNPVHEDLLEAAHTVPNVFLVNVILDGWGRRIGVVSGDLEQSHLEAIEAARPLLEVHAGERCDLAVAGAGGYPLDLNFIQAHKTLDHAAGIVRDGGVAVILAECPGGLGSTDLMSWFEMGDPEAVCKKLLSEYRIHGHTALSLMKKLERIKVILVSSLPSQAVEKLGITAARDAGEALSLARRHLREQGMTYVFPCAWGILPTV
jgi:nickel-dependent lactate racemase